MRTSRVTWRSHLLWSLTEDTKVSALMDGRTIVRTGSGDIGPFRLDDTAREVLWRMTLGPSSLENVRGLAEAYESFRSDEEAECRPEWVSVRELLARLPGCVTLSVAPEGEWRSVLSVMPRDAALPQFRDLPATLRIRTPYTIRPVRGEMRGHDVALSCDGAAYVAESSSDIRDLLEAFTADGRTVSEISDVTGITEDFVHDVARCLSMGGLLAVDP